ncbi:hypothetical protein [Salipiger sp. PrR003]|uniref:hypothetical protein n=1 Tax=Salipiger sp. PrR003 TaxID=2706776 RepID=UPI0013DC0D5D|nr:hypothetical protein [Salipiger sp. PrR003]NDV49316.1 hypothetical protein [Salipiger sp. PrR003]
MALTREHERFPKDESGDTDLEGLIMDGSNPRELESVLVMLEARSIAHRRLLLEIITTLDSSQLQHLKEWLSVREVLRDGQEDPGAVPTAMAALPLCIAEEFREFGQSLAQISSQSDSR